MLTYQHYLFWYLHDPILPTTSLQTKKLFHGK